MADTSRVGVGCCHNSIAPRALLLSVTVVMDILSLTLSLSGLVLVFALIWRHKAGFGYGKTISHDNVRLSSERYMLRGKPDRIVQRGRYFIPEEKKSGLRPAESYQAQLGVYLILIEEEYGVRPP